MVTGGISFAGTSYYEFFFFLLLPISHFCLSYLFVGRTIFPFQTFRNFQVSCLFDYLVCTLSSSFYEFTALLAVFLITSFPVRVLFRLFLISILSSDCRLTFRWLSVQLTIVFSGNKGVLVITTLSTSVVVLLQIG